MISVSRRSGSIMPGRGKQKLTKSQKRVRAAIDASSSSSSSSDEGYGSHLDDEESDDDDDESFHEGDDGGAEMSDDEVIPIDDTDDDGASDGNVSDVSDAYGEAPLSLASQEEETPGCGGNGDGLLMTQASPPPNAGPRPALTAALAAAGAATAAAAASTAMFASPAARCSKKARLLSKAALQDHQEQVVDSLVTIGGRNGSSRVEEVVCVDSAASGTTTVEHTAKKTSNEVPKSTGAADGSEGAEKPKADADTTTKDNKNQKKKKKSKLKMKKNSGGGGGSSGVPVSAVDSILGGSKKKRDKLKSQKAKGSKKKVEEDQSTAAAAPSTEKENTGNDGKSTAAAGITNLANTDDDDEDDFAPSSRSRKAKSKADKKAAAKSPPSGGGRKSSRARRSSSGSSGTGNLSEEEALRQAIAASLAESQSQPEPDEEEGKEEPVDSPTAQVEEDTKPAASEAKEGGKAKVKAVASKASDADTNATGVTETKPGSTSEEQPAARSGGVKRKKKKKKKKVASSLLADGGEGKASASTIEEPVTKKSKKVASDTASEFDDKKRSAASGAAPPAKPPPKKKKRTFQDQIYLTMLNSCTPYTLKTLAQATNSTEQQLNYVMLTLVDKNLVQTKEFPAGKTGRTKTLYWANQDARSKDVENTDANEEERMDTANELGGMQQRLRSIHAELQSVLAEPTNAELAVQVQAAEAELAALRKQAAETRERIAAATGSGNSTSPAKLKKSINGMREVWRKRKLSCMDFVDNMADAMEKSRKDAIKVLDVETDEACGAKLPPKYDL